MGQSITPFRILSLATGVVPMTNGEILTSSKAAMNGHRGLAAWLHDAETKWDEHSNKNAEGIARMSLAERVDAMGTLRAQANRATIRVLYSASGTRLSACWSQDTDAFVDKTAYWAAAESVEEAGYLAAILNTEVVLKRVRDLQPVGQRDPRHFDNLVWTLPIPEFDGAEALHADLSAAAMHAAAIVANVELPSAAHFTTQRRLVRQALADDGVAETIERLVDALLPL